MKPIHIFGFGGFAREISGVARRIGYETKYFVDKENKGSWLNIDVISEDSELLKIYPPQNALVAVGDPFLREKIVQDIMKKYPDCKFPNIIDPSCVFVVPESVILGIGVVMLSLCFVSSNVKFGDFCQINATCGIGHDTILEKYATLAMGVNLAGNCNIGQRVRRGSGVTSREKINICDDVIIGVNSAVVDNLDYKGTYVGIPARRLVKE